jgi:hypothetical protein
MNVEKGMLKKRFVVSTGFRNPGCVPVVCTSILRFKPFIY